MRSSPPPLRRVRSAHESKSASVRAAAAAPSRRQRSHWQREQRQQRLLYMAVAGLVLLVVAILAGGIVYDNLIRPNDVVAQVGPDNITASELLGAMQPRARRLQPEEKRGLPDQILNQLVDEHIVQQEAARRGISVSSADVDDRARQLVAQFAQANNPAPTPEPTPAAAATPDAS